MESINELLSQLSGDTCRIINMLIRLVINTVFTVSIAHFFYFPKSRRRDFFFTYVLAGFCIFMLIHLMGDTHLKTGIAMGLFAIFCIMRYRTESVPIREMTYLFLIISLAAINALAWSPEISDKHAELARPLVTSFSEVLMIDLIFILVIWIADKRKWVKGLSSKYIKYDKLELTTPDRHEELIADLKARTGLDITRVSIGSLDFLRDMALLKIYYNSNNDNEEDDELTKLPKLYQ